MKCITAIFNENGKEHKMKFKNYRKLRIYCDMTKTEPIVYYSDKWGVACLK